MEVKDGYKVKLGDVVIIKNGDKEFDRKVIRVSEETFSIKLNAFAGFSFPRLYKSPLTAINGNSKLLFRIEELQRKELKVVKCSIRVMAGEMIDGKMHRKYKYYEGYSHHKIAKDNGLKNVPPFNQGFLLSNGEWATREYAAKIAYQAGQIDKERKLLYSEDISEFIEKTLK